MSPSNRELATGIVMPLLFVVLLVAGWEAMARTMANPLIPDIAEIGRETAKIFASGKFLQELGVTLRRVALGFSAAFLVSLTVGIAMGRSCLFNGFAEPAILVGLTVPGLVWALLCVIWFGISLTTSTVAVALSIAPPLTLSIAQGVRTVSADLLEISAAYQLSLWARLRFLWLPTLCPFLLAGVRIGLSMAWKVIVLVEVFGLSSGVGYQLNIEFSSQNVAGVLAWTVGFALVMAILEYGFIGGLERRVTRWRRVATV
jgi:NitT/TauT family transport system permease protein